MKIKYTKENIEKAIIDSKTWTDVCRILGVKPNTGSQTHLQKRAKVYGIKQPKHFLGKASNKGKTFKNNSASKIEYTAQHPSNIKYAVDDHHKDDIPWEEEIDSIESDIFDDD